jgi:hypothetical protein
MSEKRTRRSAVTASPRRAQPSDHPGSRNGQRMTVLAKIPLNVRSRRTYQTDSRVLRIDRSLQQSHPRHCKKWLTESRLDLLRRSK